MALDFVIRHLDPKQRYKTDQGEFPGIWLIDHLKNFRNELQSLQKQNESEEPTPPPNPIRRGSIK